MKFLLLRGLMREQRHWGDFPTILKSQFPGSEVVCLDLPGTGTEIQRPCPISIEEIAEDIRKRWLELRRDGDEWNLLGISLGGMIAMKLCSLNPNDFKRLIFINSSAANLSPPWHRMKLEVIPGALLSALMGGAIQRELTILRMTTRLRSDLDEIAKIWANLAVEQPISPSTGLRQIYAASRFFAPRSSELGQVRVLVVSAAKDHFTDPRCSQNLARYLNAPISVHPSAGHDLPLDDPHWLVREISKWILNQLSL